MLVVGTVAGLAHLVGRAEPVEVVGTVAVVVALDLGALAAMCRSQGYAFARTGLGFGADSC